MAIKRRRVGDLQNDGLTTFPKNEAENGEPQLQNKRGRLTTLRVINEAGNEEPQLQNKRGRLTTLCVSNEAENGEPKLQNKGNISKEVRP